MTYSNPQLTRVISDWPFGQYRTTATFKVETHPKRGQRAVRVTVDPKTNRECAPKVRTFAKQTRIVDGSDGRTYILELSECGFISVMRSDMQLQHEIVWEKDERYQGMMEMFAGDLS